MVSGRRIGEEHKAMVDSGIDRDFRIKWIARQIDELADDMKTQREEKQSDVHRGSD